MEHYFGPTDRLKVVEVQGELVGDGGLGWIGFDKSLKRQRQGKGGKMKDVLLVGHAGIMLDTKVRGKGYAV